MDNDAKREEVSTLKKWVVAARLFAMPASLTPLVFGSLLAVAYGGAVFKYDLFLLVLVGMTCVHIAANMLNDVFDFKRGVDVVTPGSGAIIRGLLDSGAVRNVALLLLLIAAAIGGYLVYRVGMVILYIGAVGVFGAVAYTAGPFPLKYHRLGDIDVFICFGVLGALGAWTTQTGELAWRPVVWITPVALYVVAILHANNWRDEERDKRKNINTIAGLIGHNASMRYYALLLFAPYIIVTMLVVIPGLLSSSAAMPWQFLLVWLSFPKARLLYRKARSYSENKEYEEIDDLDAQSAQLNLAFGLLCIVATGIKIACL